MAQVLRLGAYRKVNLSNRVHEHPSSINTFKGSAKVAQNAKLLDPEEHVELEKRNHGLAFLHETAAYFAFLLTYTVVTVSSMPVWSYQAASVVRSNFLETSVLKCNSAGCYRVEFESVSSVAGMLEWLNDVFIPACFPETNYNGDPLDSYDQQFLGGYNRLIGPITLRQVRVSGRCGVSEVARKLNITSCSGVLSKGTEDREPYGVLHLFNNRSGYSLGEIDRLVAEGFGANVTEVPNRRFTFTSVRELCSEDPNPARAVLGTVDKVTGRPQLEGNKGLKWYCELGVRTEGKTGIVYPNGGYIEYLPPDSWIRAYNKYLAEKHEAVAVWGKGEGVRRPDFTPTATLHDAATATLRTATLCPPNTTCTVSVTAVNTTPTVLPQTHTEEMTEEERPSFDLPSVPSAKEYSLRALEELSRLRWIDEKTSLLTIEMTHYNTNVRLLLSSRILFEISPTGGVVPLASVKPMPLLTVETTSEKGLFAAELVLITAIGIYLFKELRKIWGYFSIPWRHCQVCVMAKIVKESLSPIILCPNCQEPFNPFRKGHCPECYRDVQRSHTCWVGYLTNIWNIMEATNMLLFIVIFSFRAKLRADLGNVEVQTETQPVNFFPLAWQYNFINYLNSINLLLSYLRTIRFLGQIKGLSTLVKILMAVVVPVLNFLAIFFITYLGLALAFALSYSGDVEEFRDLGHSYMSLFVILLGDFREYDNLYESSRAATIVLFVLYNVCVVLILANIFISIISGAYTVVHFNESKSRIDYLNSALRLLMRRVMTRIRRLMGNDDDHLTKVKGLLYSIQQVPSLTKEQRDDVRAFSRSLDVHYDPELLHDILVAFQADSNRLMRVEDYEVLMETVLCYKREKKARAQRSGWWAEHDEDGGTAEDVGAIPSNVKDSAEANFQRRIAAAEDMLDAVFETVGQATEAMKQQPTTDLPRQGLKPKKSVMFFGM